MSVTRCDFMLTDEWGDSIALTTDQARAAVRVYDAGTGHERVGYVACEWYGTPPTRTFCVGETAPSAADIAEMRAMLEAQGQR